MRAENLDINTLLVDGQISSAASNPNLLINGNFDIWQRGTSVTGPLTSAYSCADRWIFYDGSNGTASVSRQAFTVGQTDVPGNPTYYVQYNMTVQATAGSPGVHQKIEGVASVSGQTATFSIWAKLASGTLDVTPRLYQDFGSSGSTEVETTLSDVTITSTWQRIEMTFDVPSVSGKTISGGDDNIMLGFLIPLSSGTFTLSIAQAKFEEGGVTTPFVARPIAEEFALCHRYFTRIAGDGVTNKRLTPGMWISTVALDTVLQYPEKRVAPTISVSAAGHFQARRGVNAYDCTAVTAYNQGVDRSLLRGGVSSGGVANDSGLLCDDGNGNSYIDIEAEL